MAHWRRIVAKLHNLLSNKHAEEDLAREVESHLTLLADDFERRGVSPEEARLAARRAYGGVEQAKQTHRDERSLLWIEQTIQDLRYGLRTLSKSPGFTITAVLTLALGIGACTAIFNLVNAVLIRSLPYGDPERLVYLFSPNASLKIPAEVIFPSYGDFYDLKREAKSYADMSSFEQAEFSVTQQGTTQRIGGARVDGDFFSTLQSTAELGRTFAGEDNQPAHAKVAVISHALWVSMFGASPDVLNRPIKLDAWASAPRNGHYPDADMLPLGYLGPAPGWGVPRETRLTHDEQKTFLTLWGIVRSPLMMGGDLPHADAWTTSLLTNREFLDVDQHARDPKVAVSSDKEVVWTSIPEHGAGHYVAVFNRSEQQQTLRYTWIQLVFLKARIKFAIYGNTRIWGRRRRLA
jgi:MacB-like periplasmic core domain/Alpha galactosidase A